MTAAVSDIDTIQALVESSGLDVVVANHNAPKQVVLSGPTEAIEAVEALLGETDITARRLPVATAFHSHVVSGSTEPFLSFLSNCEFQTPTLPVYANSLGDAYPVDVDDMRRSCRPVSARASDARVYASAWRSLFPAVERSEPPATQAIECVLEARQALAFGQHCQGPVLDLALAPSGRFAAGAAHLRRPPRG